MTTNGTKEKPIIFSGPMVRAILEGRKSQTRRIVKGLPDGIECASAIPESNYQYRFTDFNGTTIDLRCPYGRPPIPLEPADRLWVRETFVLQHEVNGEAPPFDDGRPIRHDAEMDDEWTWIQPHYRATDGTPELSCFEPHKCDGGEPCCHWTPSIFMPRWASRLTLEIRDIRVERLQEISGTDALWEGMNMRGADGELRHAGDHPSYSLLEFQQGWDILNVKRGYSWESNPWVWVVGFRKVGKHST